MTTHTTRLRQIAGALPADRCRECGGLTAAAREREQARIGREALDAVKKHYGIDDDAAALAVLRGKDAGLAELAAKALDTTAYP